MRTALEQGAIARLYRNRAVAAALPGLEAEVAEGRLAPEEAADRLLALLDGQGED